MTEKKGGENSEKSCVRLDRWLFSVRIFKTRSLAAKACAGGKIKVNGVACKSHKEIRIGDEINIRREGRRLSYKVLGLLEKRVGAKDAASMYSLEEDPGLDENMRATLKIYREAQQVLPRPRGKPSKRDRRQLEKFKKGE